jgi:hypothetical protein
MLPCGAPGRFFEAQPPCGILRQTSGRCLLSNTICSSGLSSSSSLLPLGLRSEHLRDSPMPHGT